MFQVFDKTDFNDISFMSRLEENGFDVHGLGGESSVDYENGDIFKFSNGQYQMVGQEHSVLTCSPNVFFKTLIDVEKKFNYKLFG